MEFCVCEVERGCLGAPSLLSHEDSEDSSGSLESPPRRFLWEILRSNIPLRAGCSSLGRSFRRTHTCTRPSRNLPRRLFHHSQMQNQFRLQGNVNSPCVRLNLESARRLNESESVQTHAVLRGRSDDFPSFFSTLNSNLHQREDTGGVLQIPCLNLWRSWISESKGT